MQKIINVLAVLSFVGTAGIIGGGTYLYLQKDAMIERVKENLANAAVEAVSGALPGLIDASMPDMPELPKHTGGGIPLGEAGPAAGVRLP